ncbi:MAG: prepilin-type N-terminal cleavage/methylation domain-containing protein [Opitutales bacterium]
MPPASVPSPDDRGGFTLIELLVVIAIIAILAGITIGVSRGVAQKQALAVAKGEMAMLATALEDYRSKRGDYPWINRNPSAAAGREQGAHQLFRALTGWRRVNEDTNYDTPRNYRFDANQLALSDPAYDPNTSAEAIPPSTVFPVDPWGNPYVYLYKTPGDGTSWTNPGYLLMSLGEDGQINLAGLNVTTGQVDWSEFLARETNVDNIIQGR